MKPIIAIFVFLLSITVLVNVAQAWPGVPGIYGPPVTAPPPSGCPQGTSLPDGCSTNTITTGSFLIGRDTFLGHYDATLFGGAGGYTNPAATVPTYKSIIGWVGGNTLTISNGTAVVGQELSSFTANVAVPPGTWITASLGNNQYTLSTSFNFGSASAQVLMVVGNIGPYNVAMQSGQSWWMSAVPSWNIAGVDYSIGYNTTSILTPALCGQTVNGSTVGCGLTTSAAWSAFLTSMGCAPNVSTGGYLRILCSTDTGQDIVFSGVDFSGSGNNGQCVSLYFNTNIKHGVTITNSKFKNGPGCYDGQNNAIQIEARTCLTSFTMTHNSFDGDSTNPVIQDATYESTSIGTTEASLGAACNSYNGYPAIIEYNAWFDDTGDPMTGSFDNYDLQISYNYFGRFTDFCDPSTASGKLPGDCNGQHGAVIGINAINVAPHSMIYSYNTCLYNADYLTGTSCYTFLGRGGGADLWPTATEDHNLAISNQTGMPTGNTPAHNTASAALSEILHDREIQNLTYTNNIIDPTGATGCITNNGDGTSIQTQAIVQGTISGTVLTVNSVTSGTVVVGQMVAGSGVDNSTSPTVVSSLGTGTGGPGTYNLNKSQSVGTAEQMMLGYSTMAQAAPGGDFEMTIAGVGGIVGYYSSDTTSTTPNDAQIWLKQTGDSGHSYGYIEPPGTIGPVSGLPSTASASTNYVGTYVIKKDPSRPDIYGTTDPVTGQPNILTLNGGKQFLSTNVATPNLTIPTAGQPGANVNAITYNSYVTVGTTGTDISSIQWVGGTGWACDNAGKTVLYTQPGIHYDQFSNVSVQGKSYPGLSDSSVGTISFWLKCDFGISGTSAANTCVPARLFGNMSEVNNSSPHNCNTLPGICIMMDNPNGNNGTFTANFNDSTGGGVATHTCKLIYYNANNSNTWHHYLLSWNFTSANNVALYVDGTQAATGCNSLNYTGSYPLNVNLSSALGYSPLFAGNYHPAIGSTYNGVLPGSGEIADIYEDYTTTLLTTGTNTIPEASIAPFINDLVQPYVPGTNCSAYTGAQPEFCFLGPKASFLTNLGTLGTPSGTSTQGSVWDYETNGATPTFGHNIYPQWIVSGQTYSCVSTTCTANTSTYGSTIGVNDLLIIAENISDTSIAQVWSGGASTNGCAVGGHCPVCPDSTWTQLYENWDFGGSNNGPTVDLLVCYKLATASDVGTTSYPLTWTTDKNDGYEWVLMDYGNTNIAAPVYSAVGFPASGSGAASTGTNFTASTSAVAPSQTPSLVTDYHIDIFAFPSANYTISTYQFGEDSKFRDLGSMAQIVVMDKQITTTAATGTASVTMSSSSYTGASDAVSIMLKSNQ